MSREPTRDNLGPEPNNRFDRDTQMTAIEPGRYRGRMNRGWWIARGPNGGYLAAMLLRAMQQELGDTGRKPRSLTIHYTAPPEEGAVEVLAQVERSGRSASTLTARMLQGDRLCALVTGAFSKPRDATEFCDLEMPQVPDPEDCPIPWRPEGIEMGFRDRYEIRHAIGSEPFRGGGGEGLTGGWIRPTEPRPLDALLVGALTDAWPPAFFSRCAPDDVMRGVPTLDLTIHFRRDAAKLRLAEDSWYLVKFWTRLAAEGFMEEDGEVWSADGTLLAQSRQLAVLL
jgi:acyl-CoA thioesterase